MTTPCPIARLHRKAKLRRMLSHWRQHKAQIRRDRNPVAKALRAPGGPFAARVIPSSKHPGRHSRHRQRAWVEVMALSVKSSAKSRI
jgi:hypothetical protein